MTKPVDFKKKYAKSKIHNLGAAYVKLREQHAEIKSGAAAVWAEVDYLRLTKIPEMLNEMEVSSVKIKGVGTLGTRMEASCSTKDKDALIKWLRSNDFEDLISTDTVNSSTLKAFINNQIKDGGIVPPVDVVKFTPFEMAVVTK